MHMPGPDVNPCQSIAVAPVAGDAPVSAALSKKVSLVSYKDSAVDFADGLGGRWAGQEGGSLTVGLVGTNLLVESSGSRIEDAQNIAQRFQSGGPVVPEMIFVGDERFPGANDYPARELGVASIRVREPDESNRAVEAIPACLDPVRSRA